MAPGALIRIKPTWCHCYRRPGTATVGIVEALSPNGAVARVRFDEVAASFILVTHLELAERRRSGSNGSVQRRSRARDQADVALV